MYTLKGHDGFNSCLASLSSNAKQIITEVIVKGQTVLIRKTTAIWLFQETEYVSAEVRFKQPCALIDESKETASVKNDKKAAIKKAHVGKGMKNLMTSSTDCRNQCSAVDFREY